MPTNPRRDPRIAIIGAGMSGICAGVKLRAQGMRDFVIYEKADRVGGTWRDNTYPGLSCDIPSRFYCYTFAPNPDWSRLFSPGEEIREYLQRVAKDFDIEAHIRFGTEVEHAEWVEGRWRVRTSDGDESAFDFVIAASGVLHHPRTPDIPGLDDFQGSLFHSARWDHSVVLDGRRIGVVGTGSTGVQITKALAPRCSSYKLFQRTPQWVLPCGSPAYSDRTRRLLNRFPSLNRRWGKAAYHFYRYVFEVTFATAVVRPGWQRRLLTTMCKLHLMKAKDHSLRERLRPSDKPMCKRTVMAVGFYETFNAGHAELVDTGIDHVAETGIVTTDGTLHELDVLVLATGFHAHSYVQPVELIGHDGLRLSEAWSEAPSGYRTVAIPGFPNFFLLLGPHSPIGNQSLFMITENQVDYALQWINGWRAEEFDAAAPSQDATSRYNAELDDAFPDTIWASGCSSWYLAGNGRPSIWPLTAKAHRDMLADPHHSEWLVDRCEAAR